MPSDAEFDCVIVRIEEQIGQVGDAVVEPAIDRDRNSRTVGFVAERTSYTYQVVGSPDTEFFNVTFPYSLVTQLAGLIDEPAAREILEATATRDGETGERADGEDAPDLTTRAALAALDDVSEENREAFLYHLVLVLSSGRAAYSLEHTESGMLSGFTVSTRMFPFEAGYGLREFDRNVQSVVNAGIGALLFVNQAFDFRSMIDAAGVSGILPRYIH
jgi:hypothetical protein